MKIKKYIKAFGKLLLYLFISLFAALVIRLFLFNFYDIPSDSMEPAILPGDYILVNKWTYGARIFTRLKFGRNNDPPMVRTPGLGHIRRNDIIAFNFPYRYRWDTVRMNLDKIFVKRCIGLPGDSLSIVGGYYRIAGLPDTVGNRAGQQLLAMYRGELEPQIIHTFPYDSVINWNVRNFGPLYVPGVGSTIALTPRNFKLYRRLLVFETGARIRATDSAVFINDTLASHYTFRSNWYFVAGDKVINSQDSRYIGLVPESYIIGKVSRVLSSKDVYTGKRRWKRTMKRVE